MDTTVPRGCNPERYIELKYCNQEKLDNLVRIEPIIDKRLLFHVALKHYLECDVNDIIMELREYYGTQDENTRRNE